MVCHPHAHKVVYEAQIVDPEQREEFRHFVSHCTSKMFLYDIVAHFGVFSVVAAHFGGKAVAVDPSPTATRMIATEALLNRCTDRIQILQAAVSDVNGALNMLSSGVYSAGYFKVAKGRSRRDLTQTQSFTIDQMVYHFGAPSHIKIDVEGHEAAVLRGATNTLTRYSPLLFLELHNEMVISEGGDPRFPLDELARLGYATFALNGESISREAILSRSIIRIKASKGKCLRDEE
jgi:FkbM family methyltransferase